MSVMFGPGPDIPQHRTARLIWRCDPQRSLGEKAGCPSNCIAQNQLPYSTVEYDPKNFPEDTWVVFPCELHGNLFAAYPDVPN